MIIYDGHVDTNIEFLQNLLLQKDGQARVILKDDIRVNRDFNSTFVFKALDGCQAGTFLIEEIQEFKIRLQIETRKDLKDCREHLLLVTWLILESIYGKEYADNWIASIPEGGIKANPIHPYMADLMRSLNKTDQPQPEEPESSHIICERMKIPLPIGIFYAALDNSIRKQSSFVESTLEKNLAEGKRIVLRHPSLGEAGEIYLLGLGPNKTQMDILCKDFSYKPEGSPSSRDYLQNEIIPSCFIPLLNNYDLWIENAVIPPSDLIELAGLKDWPDYTNMRTEEADDLDQNIKEIEGDILDQPKSDSNQVSNSGNKHKQKFSENAWAYFEVNQKNRPIKDVFKEWKDMRDQNPLRNPLDDEWDSFNKAVRPK